MAGAAMNLPHPDYIPGVVHPHAPLPRHASAPAPDPMPEDAAAKLAELRSASAARAAASAMSVEPKKWAEMDVSVRTVLVMLASTQKGDPDRIARQPWGAFSQADQIAMAGTARMLHGVLAPWVLFA
jgi:hypothetical protein